MNEYINFYKDNPTAGETDGTAISLDDAGNAPLSVVLDASKGETKILKCAIRCREGYRTEGETTLSFTGATAGKWSLAADRNYADAKTAEVASFSGTLTIAESIGAANTVFWVKACASTDEKPGIDASVKLVGKAPILPVA